MKTLTKLRRFLEERTLIADEAHRETRRALDILLKRGKSLRAIARECSVSPTYVSVVKNNRVKPSLEFCIKVLSLYESR